MARKRGYDIDKLGMVVDLLSTGAAFPIKSRDHALTGGFDGFRECHITADWLLVYRIEQDVLVLYLLRTGTYSDLF